MKRTLPFIIIIAVLGIALVSAWYFTRTMPTSTTVAGSQPPQPAKATGSQPAQVQPVATNGAPGAEPAHILGPANAPARLEEFGDFECPPCGLFHPILVEMHKEFGDKLQITFREFPLVPTHQHALAAASAAEAAGMQDKFWEMHDLLYDRQNDWKKQFDVRPVFEGYAKEIGLDVERYKRDLISDSVARRITLDGARGHSLGVSGTPTVFLNGHEVPFQSLMQEDQFRVILQREIDNAGKR